MYTKLFRLLRLQRQKSFLHQTFKKAEAESQKLEDLCRELGCPENIVHQWIHDVRQWAADGTVFYGHSSK